MDFEQFVIAVIPDIIGGIFIFLTLGFLWVGCAAIARWWRGGPRD